MRAVGLIVTGCLALAAATQPAIADAQPTSACEVPAYLLASESTLPKVEAAIRNKQLDIVIIGSRSSTLAPGLSAYPSRLQDIMREKMAGVTVNVTPTIQPSQTAEEAKAAITAALASGKPALVIWQTGTVDAMRGVDLEDFRGALEDGVAEVQKANADIILMNLQYSPRTETMTSTGPYLDNMRVVAQQRGVPLFDRFAIMRQWSDNGDFDLFNPAAGTDLARRVHDCLARALSSFILEAARGTAGNLGNPR